MKKRPLGQNFLIDCEAAREIVLQADINPEDPVLEIGPGKGILTEFLLEKTGALTALEVDSKLCTALDARFGSNPGFKLLEADALKFDFGRIGPRFKVVANLPYYAATHILKRLIYFQSHVIDMTVMLQKEVVDRLVAEPGQKEYGSLSVFVQYHNEVRRVLEVGREAFSPPPKIDSSVVKLIPLQIPKVDVKNETIFFKIVHAAFLHKRKMLKNNLKGWENQFLKENGKIHMAGIDLSQRGETLSLEDFATLSNFVHPHHE